MIKKIFHRPKFFLEGQIFLDAQIVFGCPKVKFRWSKIIWKAKKNLVGADGMGISFKNNGISYLDEKIMMFLLLV